MRVESIRECRIADWRDAFVPAPLVGVMDRCRAANGMRGSRCFRRRRDCRAIR
jgi:hypothetical protein